MEINVVGEVKFLAEQDGGIEREFKRMLRPLLDASHVQNAYLAHVTYGQEREPGVAVCLCASAPEDALVRAIMESFDSMGFGPGQGIDVLYLEVEQEIELLRVCQPFFSKSSA